MPLTKEQIKNRKNILEEFEDKILLEIAEQRAAEGGEFISHEEAWKQFENLKLKIAE